MQKLGVSEPLVAAECEAEDRAVERSAAADSLTECETLLDAMAGAPALRPARLPSLSNPLWAEEDRAGDPGARVACGFAERLVGVVIERRYRIESVLAEGGMGVVYRARHTVLEKPVAIKVLHPRVASRAGAAERFLDEARAVSAIGSAHIIDVVDFGTMPDGAPYLVMEFLEGAPLSALMRGGGLGLGRAVDIASQIAVGLELAHASGIVHRDLKPDNVLVLTRDGRDHVKILDFGVAKVSHGCSEAPGCVVGTPHYMSPEQAIGGDVDGRADVYSLGVMLYEMVTGSLPFKAGSARRIMELHVTTPPLPPSSIHPERAEIPGQLEALILDCLAKDPDRRPRSMRAVRRTLEEIKVSHLPRVVVTPEPPRELQPVDSWPTLADSPRAFPVQAEAVCGPGEPERARASVRNGADGEEMITGAPEPEPARAPGRRRFGGLVAGVVVLCVLGSLAASRWIGPAILSDARTNATKRSGGSGVTDVAVLLSPVDAEVFRGGQSLGPMPLTVRVRPGAPLELEARRAGYVPSRFVVDGARRRVEVVLMPLPGLAAAAPCG